MFSDISGVILAGGTSSRLGGITKANIELGGKTIISRMLDIITPLFGEIIIVTNTPEEFPSLANHIITGDRFMKTGPLGGIHAALRTTSAKAAFVFAGDMPLISKDIVERLADRYLNTDCDILVPLVNNYIEPLHSVYNISILPLIEKYLESAKDFAVREFVKQTRVEYLVFEPSKENINAFSNINTAADLNRINRIVENL